MWNKKKVTPVIIGATGTILKTFRKRLEQHSGKERSRGTTKKHTHTHTQKNSHIWHCTHTSESTNVNTMRTGSFKLFKRPLPGVFSNFNPLNAELNPICYFLALLAHHFLHVSRISVKSLTLRLLMLYIYIYIYTWRTYS